MINIEQNQKMEVHMFYPIKIHFASLYFELITFEFKERLK